MYADAVSYMIVDEHYIIHCGMCRLRRMLVLVLQYQFPAFFSNNYDGCTQTFHATMMPSLSIICI
jgi:hypothetical protein